MFDWQTILVALIVFVAAIFVWRRVLKKLRAFSGSSSADCATGCGKCK